MREAENVAVTRAVLRTMRYDPDKHDLAVQSGKKGGVWVVTAPGGEKLRFIPKDEFVALTSGDEFQISMQALLPRERLTVAEQMSNRVGPAVIDVKPDAPPVEPAA